MRGAVLGQGRVKHLDLSGTTDLACTNVMCARVGEGACVCKLMVWVERQAGALGALETVSMRDSGLDQVPAGIFRLPAIRHVDLSGNPLAGVDPAAFASETLQTLDLSRTALTALDPALLDASPALERVDIADTPLSATLGGVDALRPGGTRE